MAAIPAHLDAEVVLRDTLPHPDLEPLVDDTAAGPSLERHERELLLRIPGDIAPDHAAVLEEAVWDADELREPPPRAAPGRVHGRHRPPSSESLALVQVILLYHLVSARAALAVGGLPRPQRARPTTGADSALHA